MSKTTVIQGRFHSVNGAAATIRELGKLGIPDERIEVLSGFLYTHEMLGRPHQKTILPIISIGSAVAGFLLGLFMTVVTPNLYVMVVGGQPTIPIPPTALLQFEFTMIGLILGTFLGFLWLNLFPSLGPAYYDKRISDGEIGIFVHCDPDSIDAVRKILVAQRAENVHEAERRAI